METIRAKIEAGELLLVERSAGLPEPPSRSSSLILYLVFLTGRGWKAVRGSFQKEELTLMVEYSGEKPPVMPLYTVQTLLQTTHPEAALSLMSNEINAMAAGQQEVAARQGWQVLATSRPVSRRGFLHVLSLWMKEVPAEEGRFDRPSLGMN